MADTSTPATPAAPAAPPVAVTNAKPAPEAPMSDKSRRNKLVTDAVAALKEDANGDVEVNLTDIYVVHGVRYGPGPSLVPIEDAKHLVKRLTLNEIQKKDDAARKLAEYKALRGASKSVADDDDDDDDEATS